MFMNFVSGQTIQSTNYFKKKLTYFFLKLSAVLGDEFIEINRKMGYEELHKSNADDIVAENQPTKFVLEVTNGNSLTLIIQP